MTNPYSGWAMPPASPALRWFAISPDDDNDLAIMPRGIYVGGDGDVEIVNGEGDDVTLVGCKAGTILPVCPTRVKAAATTATGLVGLY